ncbi:ADP-ribosylglycohydrolase family protein [Streptomyces sp. TRM66268-LWL]|uniref:ADP-ribosylglycohydrolase family protein n=1 Tax=Streptomyces polyasparticus TaxID=2767826 RepID=A0ABR7SVV6_9ACTN|nr:ADP-ribosylglycohydrolase family protein [Streptomyces polyasparticus]MBC9719646.1 ADP-ribosylglycohydrolase family protein [Streptomyces polyasparticus]
MTAPAKQPMRLPWVQPEDLIGHGLRQAIVDKQDCASIARRWSTAGGLTAPARAGSSTKAVPLGLRRLADRLLDDLSMLGSPFAANEPTGIEAIRWSCLFWPERRPIRGADLLGDRLLGAWLGRAAGCLLGKPIDELPVAGIRDVARATHNWPLNTWFTAKGMPPGLAELWTWNGSSGDDSLAENIDGMPEAHDLNYPVLGLLLLERIGRDFTTSDVANLWLDELPAGRTVTAERIAYRNLLQGLEPPETARYRNPFREWIGAQTRADVHGWTNPGDPAAAAEAAWRDAVLSHTGNGVYGAMFVAAMLAAAAGGETDVGSCLRVGLTVVPERSRLSAAVRYGIDLAQQETTGGISGFERIVDQLHVKFGHMHGAHVIPNVALVAAALQHSRGDFTGAICRAVSGGWDTDANGATVGSVTGLLTGASGLPERWTAPLHNRLSTSIAGLDGVGFDALAERTLDLVDSTVESSDGTAGGQR